MREIEFRGLVVDEPNTWVYGYLMPDNRIYQTVEPKRGCCGIGTFSVVPDSIGQYTGCRDVNGIKIYENDIVKETYGSRFYQVIYDTHGFVLNPVFVDSHFYQSWINPKRLEVIGNSYVTREGEKKVYEREQTTKTTINAFKRIREYIFNILR